MGFSVPSERTEGGGPSENQLKFANDLAQKNSLVIPEETLKSGKSLSLWIEVVVGTKSQKADPAAVVPKAKASARKKKGVAP